CIDYTVEKSHAMDVIDSFLEVAPEATAYILGSNPSQNMQFCIDNEIWLYNMSTNGYWYNPTDNAKEDEYVSKGGIMICCAGNSGNNGLWQSATKPNFISVGAVRMTENNTVARTGYSSYSLN